MFLHEMKIEEIIEQNNNLHVEYYNKIDNQYENGLVYEICNAAIINEKPQYVIKIYFNNERTYCFPFDQCEKWQLKVLPP